MKKEGFNPPENYLDLPNHLADQVRHHHPEENHYHPIPASHDRAWGHISGCPLRNNTAGSNYRFSSGEYTSPQARRLPRYTRAHYTMKNNLPRSRKK